MTPDPATPDPATPDPTFCDKRIYHICRETEWNDILPDGPYLGSSQDMADGFIHFSTASQLAASAAKHRAGQIGLVLICVSTEQIDPILRWEASRGGALFPHLYGPLPLACVLSVWPLPVGPDGVHQFPMGIA